MFRGFIVVVCLSIVPSSACGPARAPSETGARLELTLVERTPWMDSLAECVRYDPAARELGLVVRTEPFNGAEAFLAGPRAALVRYLSGAGLRPEAHHELLLGPTKDAQTWRSYYLNDLERLVVEQVASAQTTVRPHPGVLVELPITQRSRLADLSARHLGARLAIIVADEVVAAPVIREQLTQARVLITPADAGAQHLENLADRLRGIPTR